MTEINLTRNVAEDATVGMRREEREAFNNKIHKSLLDALFKEIEENGYVRFYKEISFSDDGEHPGSLVSGTASVNFGVSLEVTTTEDKIKMEAMERVISKFPYGYVALREEMDNIKGERREW